MKFRTKPFEIEAVRWTGDNFTEMQRFAKSNFNLIEEDQRPYTDDPEADAEIYNSLHSTWVLVLPGQWIIKDSKDSFYPCDDDIFQAKYEQL